MLINVHLVIIHLEVKIRKTTHSISPYLYNAIQIQPQIFVQITSKTYAAELEKKNANLFFRLYQVQLDLVGFSQVVRLYYDNQETVNLTNSISSRVTKILTQVMRYIMYNTLVVVLFGGRPQFGHKWSLNIGQMPQILSPHRCQIMIRLRLLGQVTFMLWLG